MISNPDSRTRIDEIGDGIYRISIPVTVVPGGFSFNQYLIVDDEPLLFHTGLRQMFPLVRESIDTVMPAERLRYISFSHYEADECASLNDFSPYRAQRCTAVRKDRRDCFDRRCSRPCSPGDG
jgi:flavorubredoxin